MKKKNNPSKTGVTTVVLEKPLLDKSEPTKMKLMKKHSEDWYDWKIRDLKKAGRRVWKIGDRLFDDPNAVRKLLKISDQLDAIEEALRIYSRERRRFETRYNLVVRGLGPFFKRVDKEAKGGKK